MIGKASKNHSTNELSRPNSLIKEHTYMKVTVYTSEDIQRHHSNRLKLLKLENQ